MKTLIKPGQTKNELFKYFTVAKPRIIDVKMRLSKAKKLEKRYSQNKIAFAEDIIASIDKPVEISTLKFQYFKYLTIDKLHTDALPSVDDIKDIEEFKKLNIIDDKNYKDDYNYLLSLLVSYKAINNKKEISHISRLFDFVDSFPRLYRIKAPEIYAIPIFERMKFKIPKIKEDPETEHPDLKNREPLEKYEEKQTIVNDILQLWHLKNNYKQKRQEEFDLEEKAIREEFYESTEKIKHTQKTKETKIDVISQNKNAKISKKQAQLIKNRNKKFFELKEKKKIFNKSMTLMDMITINPVELLSDNATITQSEVIAIQKRLKDAHITTHVNSNVNNCNDNSFCHAYHKSVKESDKQKMSSSDPLRQNCFNESPEIKLIDNIRIFGPANLVKVEETLIGYRCGEVSHINNILPHAESSLETRETNYDEETYTIDEEISNTETKKLNSTSKQDLSSNIQNEINSRFNSDVNVSGGAHGSGKIPAFGDLEGEASAAAGIGVGMDSSLTSTSSSKLSREIVDEAVKSTKKSVHEHRLNRTYNLIETHETHEIDNRENDNPINGIYMFLDKEVCIEETVTEKRLFLLSNIKLPGKSLICKKKISKQLKIEELGEKPQFNLSPEDIQPNNYLRLIEKYKATGVQPPPEPTKMITKTYKTDSMNTNVEQQEFNVKKVADILVPFFERYKRFIINDTLQIPEGYEALETKVTVNHGKNGLSIPAHLPLSIAGASMYTAPSLLSTVSTGGITLPIALWQIAYLASPLLHYNTDSSNVTITVGNESYDSSYYFFDADVLIQEIFNIFSSFPAFSSDFLGEIRGNIDNMITNLTNNLSHDITDRINNKINKIKDILNIIEHLFDVENLKKIIEGDADSLVELSNIINELSEIAPLDADIFEPLQTFINEILEMITSEMSEALIDIVEYLTGLSENTQNFDFNCIAGMRGDIPLSLNTIAIKPGVSVTLTLCTLRTEEALEKWQLDTYSKLYQAYVDMAQEYENDLSALLGQQNERTSPGNMRKEELAVVKERVLHTLNNYHSHNGNHYDFEHINFFETAIDWEYMSYQLFTYGPNMTSLILEKDGIFSNVDRRRETFLKAQWARVLIPIRKDPNDIFSAQIMKYFENGDTEFEGEFEEDELTALYQDLILNRDQSEEDSEVSKRKVIIPTDMIILKSDLDVCFEDE